jgi:hypothetical protein
MPEERDEQNLFLSGPSRPDECSPKAQFGYIGEDSSGKDVARNEELRLPLLFSTADSTSSDLLAAGRRCPPSV